MTTPPGAARWAGAIVVCLSLLVNPVAAVTQAPPGHRAVSGATGRPTTLDAMAMDLATADVVFVGASPDDVAALSVELALFDAVARRRGDVSIAIEALDRTMQEPLDHFQMGHTGEADFLDEARPGGDYQRSSGPLVDFAIGRQWNIVAPNAAVSIVADVAASGQGALGGRSDADRRLFAQERRCEADGAYFDRVTAARTSRGSDDERLGARRAFDAHCLQDETIAESLAQSYAAGAAGGRRPLVISVNDVARVDLRQGVVAGIVRRLPRRRIVTVVFVRDDAATPVPAATPVQADYVVQTRP